MKAILVDDEPDGIRVLQKLLQRHCPQVQIAATCCNAIIAKQQLQEIQPDVVFMDINMPGKSGLDLLTELTVKNFEVIFVTAHSEFMLQALQYSAVDYLLKPVIESRLMDAVQRVEKRLGTGMKSEHAETLVYNLTKSGHPAEMRLCLSTLKGFIILKLDDIIYSMAGRSYTIFYLTGDRKVTASKPLADYEKILTDAFFLRVHKSYLINLNHVKEYQRGDGGVVIMSNNEEIEISRRKKDQFLQTMKEVFRFD